MRNYKVGDLCRAKIPYFEAHRRILAGWEILRNHGRNNNSPGTGSPCRPAGYSRQPSSACLCSSEMDTRSVFAADGHHRPQRTLRSSRMKRGRRGSDHADRRPSTLPDTVQTFGPKLRVGSFHRSDSEGCTIVTIERHSSDRLSAGPLYMRAPRAPGSPS
jgi:hypothetical protein